MTAELAPRNLEPRNPRNVREIPATGDFELAPATDVPEVLNPLESPTPTSPELGIDIDNPNLLNVLDQEAIIDGRTLPGTGGRSAKADYSGLHIRLKGVEDYDDATFTVLSHTIDQAKDIKTDKQGIMPLPFRRTEAKQPSGKFSHRLRLEINMDGPARGLRTLMPTRKEKMRSIDVDTEVITLGRFNEHGQLILVQDVTKGEFGNLVQASHLNQLNDYAKKRKDGVVRKPETQTWWGDVQEFDKDRYFNIDTPLDESESVFAAITQKQSEEGLDSLRGLSYQYTKTHPSKTIDHEVVADNVVYRSTRLGWKPQRLITIQKVDPITGNTSRETIDVVKLKANLDKLDTSERATLHAFFEVPDPPAPEAPVPDDVRDQQNEMIQDMATKVMPKFKQETKLDIDDIAEKNIYQRLGMGALLGKGLHPDDIEKREQFAEDKTALLLLTAAEIYSEESRPVVISNFLNSEVGQRNFDALRDLAEVTDGGWATITETALKMQHEFHTNMRELGLDVNPVSASPAWAINALAEQHYFNQHPATSEKLKTGLLIGDPFDDNPANRLHTMQVKRQLVDRMVGMAYEEQAVQFTSHIDQPKQPGEKINTQTGQPRYFEKPDAARNEQVLETTPEVIVKEIEPLLKELEERVREHEWLTGAQAAELGRHLRSSINHNS